MNNTLGDLAYTGIRDRPYRRKTSSTKTLHKLVENIQNKTFAEIIDSSDDLQGEGFKIILPSNIIDIYTGLEILLGPKLSVHTITLTEASNVIDELYKRDETQNGQHFQNAFGKFST